MDFISVMAAMVGCALLSQPQLTCLGLPQFSETHSVSSVPVRTGEAVDVVLSAEAALVWDWKTDEILYAKQIDTPRPIASLSKLVTVLATREVLQPDDLVTITPEAIAVQRLGAHIKLPVGETVSMRELTHAALVASANDAAVALAAGAFGSQEKFVAATSDYLKKLGALNTQVANATGLSGGTQHSTARDVKTLLTSVYRDSLLGPYLAAADGVLTTEQGTSRRYKSTNKLLGTYLPIIAAKTGYTTEAGENLAILTTGSNGQMIGVVILGSEERFQDTKVLVEWVWRNYTWRQP